MKRHTTTILGVKIDTLTVSEAEQRFYELTKTEKPSLICTPNTEMIIRANSMLPFKELLNNKSKLNLPDGFGLIWAANFLSKKSPENEILRPFYIFASWFFSILFIPFFSNRYRSIIKERITGADFIWNMSKIAAKEKLRLFLLGGEPTIAEQAALKLQTDVPDLRVTGTLGGKLPEDKEIIEIIRKSKADILIVALQFPRQEFWLEENLGKSGCKVGIGIGGTFDFIAGKAQRAPAWMQKRGLEWLFRLILEPRKRFIRQLAIPKLMWLVLIERLNNGRTETNV